MAFRAFGKILLPATLLLAGCAGAPGLQQIDNVVVIYAENRSFDHLYGLFPGADGIAQASVEEKTQVDHDGRPLEHLPPTWVHGKPSPRFATEKLPNGPFRIDAPPINGRMDEVLPSPWHLYYQNREQIDKGRNDRFAAMSNVGGWVMGYFDGSQMRMWKWAREYTLADHFFMGAFGGSFLNHFWLVCACTPVDSQAPKEAVAQLELGQYLKKKPGSPASALDGPVQVLDGRATPDGYLVNTSQPPYQPSGIAPAAGGDLNLSDPQKHPAPPQTMRTIADALEAKGVSWAWYAGGWDAALADGRRPPGEKRAVIYSGATKFQPHHQPFNYFARFAPGSDERAQHLKDEKDFVAAIDAGTLPQVVFFKPAGRYTEHPSYTDIMQGDVHLDELLSKLKASPQWQHMAIIVTYDENGGFWDHVPPPTGPGAGDRWGPGTRIPAMIISPYARRGYVDKTPYDTTSILKFITRRFLLDPLPGVRAKAGDLTNAFLF